MSINNIRKYESRFDYEFGSDPLVTTNPPRVGDSWVNNVTGEIFVCIDATADDNVWKGTQGNTIISYRFEGSQYGFILGGEENGTGQPNSDDVQYFSFSNDSTIIADLDQLAAEHGDGNCSVKSQSALYCLGGASGFSDTNTIEKALISSGPALTWQVLVATLDVASAYVKGVSSENKGYYFGRGRPGGILTKRFVQFSNDSENLVNGGDFTYDYTSGYGVTGNTHGYGIAGDTSDTKNEKFAYSNDVVNVGISDLSVGRSASTQASTSNTEYGFLLGSSSPSSNSISRITFSNDTISENFSTLSTAMTSFFASGCGISGENAGYYAFRDFTATVDSLDKFSYTSGVQATSVSTLQDTSYYSAGSQY